MPIESLEEEVVRLRAELDARKTQELAGIRMALVESQRIAEHYRAEAQRNAQVGREIAANYQEQVAELRSKIEAMERLEPNARRIDFSSK